MERFDSDCIDYTAVMVADLDGHLYAYYCNIPCTYTFTMFYAMPERSVRLLVPCVGESRMFVVTVFVDHAKSPVFANRVNRCQVCSTM